MATWEIDFAEQYPDPEDRYIAALAYTKDYLGDELWSKFKQAYLLNEEDTRVFDIRKAEVRSEIRLQIRAVCSFFWGIEGYPVLCLQRFVFRTHLQRMRIAS